MPTGLTYAHTICPYCTSGCALSLVLKDNRIIGQESVKSYPLNEGKNCIKGNSAHKFLDHPDRLKKPRIRGKESSWEDALALTAETFKKAAPDRFGVLASGKTSNEESYLLQKFARAVLHTNNIDYCARFCHASTVAGLLPTVGSGVMQCSQLDLDQPDAVILAGVNVAENFPGIARRLKRARARGTKVVVIDPRATLTAKVLADLHLPLMPGTDVALLQGMVKVLIDRGLVNREFVRTRTVGFEELARSVAETDLGEIEKITSVPREKIAEAAVCYGSADRGSILFDEGITQHVSGSDNVKMLAALALLTGHIGKAGAGVNPLRGQISGEGSGDMGCVNVFYPGFKKVGPESAHLFEGLWGAKALPSERGKTYMDILNDCGIVYAVGVNPMISAPDTTSVRRAIEKLDFFVVQDIFMTETAELADVVLPAAAWVEREGTHTGVDRRVVKIDKLVDPPGEARPDWWIITRLAEKMGSGERFAYDSAREIFDEIRNCIPPYAGITYERLAQTNGGIHWPCPSEDHPGTPTMFAEKFNTPDGKGHFLPVEFKPPAESPDDEYPYVLTTGRVIFHYHTGTTTRRTENLNRELSDGFVQMNPADARQLHVQNGEAVKLRSRRGEIIVQTRISTDIPEGVVFVPFHFGKARANVLTNPAFDPACKMPEFKVCAVAIEPLQKNGGPSRP